MEIERVRDIPKHRPYQGARAQLPPGKCHSSGHTGTAGTPRPQAKVTKIAVHYGDSLESVVLGQDKATRLLSKGGHKRKAMVKEVT